MVLTQDNLIKQIAKREDINVAIVRSVIKSMEKIIFDHLSSTTPSENMVVKPIDGLSIECEYVPEKEVFGFANFIAKNKIKAIPKITRHYNRKLNHYFDN